jgi:DNA-binding GntR family transcriptional regulator
MTVPPKISLRYASQRTSAHTLVYISGPPEPVVRREGDKEMAPASGAQQSRRREGKPGAVQRLSPYEMLKQAIFTGEIPPGQPLVEVALAEWCGVSRTPIREALLRLEQDGFLDRSDHGLIVRERSPEEILDLYYTRMVLEAAAARVAAERRSDHDVLSIRWALENGESVPDTDSSAMVAVNQRFHRAIWRASHNESLVDLLGRLELHLARYPGTTLSSPGRWVAARIEHRQILEAIERRDGDEASAIAMAHFREARDIRLTLFAREASFSG